jgi:hypothetical protein
MSTGRGGHGVSRSCSASVASASMAQDHGSHCANPCMTSRAWIAEDGGCGSGREVEAWFQTVVFVEG